MTLFDLESFAEPGSDAPEPAPASLPAPGLTDEALAMLRLAGQYWRNGSAKDQAVRDRFGISPTRFHQRINALLPNPAAMAAEPLIVRRLQRIADARRRMKTTRVGGARRG